MKKISIITKRFPYFYTEAFLESEYPYLKKSFKDMVFIPIFKGKLRESCDDVNVCDAYNTLYKKKHYEAFMCIISIHFYLSLIRNLRHLFSKGYLRKLIHQDTHYRVLNKVIRSNPKYFDENTIVYSYWFDSQVYALIRLREVYGYKYKVVTRAHRYDVYDENGEMPNRRYCIEHIDKVFPISQDAIDFFTKKYANENKFSLARLGVNDSGSISKESLGNSLNFISVSQVSERKRILTIYRTLEMFAAKHPEKEVSWIHFGDGPLDSKLHACAIKNKLLNFKVIIGGRVANTEIKKYFAENRIDVFVNLSSSEGVPVSVMEALSYGVPVVATNVGGTAEIMTSRNGVLLSANPTDDEIVTAYETCVDAQYDRNLIKEDWNKTSNAKTQFSEFVNLLYNIS